MSLVLQCDTCQATISQKMAKANGWEIRWEPAPMTYRRPPKHICHACAERERTQPQRDEIEQIMRDAAKKVAHLVKQEKKSERPVDPHMFLGGKP